MKITNKSNKVIGLGEEVLLPEKTIDLPKDFEDNPVIKTYKNMGMIELSGNPKKPRKTAEQVAAEKAAAEAAKQEEAEALRKERLKNLPSMTEEEVAKLAQELGVNPANCKTQADVVRKVRAALRK